MCVGCRGRGPRSVLLRVVSEPDGDQWSAVLDPDRRRPGRGAWLHPDPACLDQAERRKALPRALRRSGQGRFDGLRQAVAAELEYMTNRPDRKRV